MANFQPIGKLELEADGPSLTIRLSGAPLEANHIYKAASSGLQLAL